MLHRKVLKRTKTLNQIWFVLVHLSLKCHLEWEGNFTRIHRKHLHPPPPVMFIPSEWSFSLVFVTDPVCELWSALYSFVYTATFSPQCCSVMAGPSGSCQSLCFSLLLLAAGGIILNYVRVKFFGDVKMPVHWNWVVSDGLQRRQHPFAPCILSWSVVSCCCDAPLTSRVSIIFRSSIGLLTATSVVSSSNRSSLHDITLWVHLSEDNMDPYGVYSQ